MSGPLPVKQGAGAADEPLWYHAPDNRSKLGPFTVAQLRQQAAEGRLDPGDMMLRQGEQKWVPAAEVPGLFDETLSGPATRPAHELESLSAPKTVVPPGCRGIPGYEFLGELGAGGMGVVYRARQLGMNRVVALKIVRPELALAPQAVRRFQREIEAAARLAPHPHLVTAYDAGEAEGRPFLVMEYVEGRNLSQLLKDTGPLPPHVACDLVRQAALGLGHLHQSGLVHRDLKPSNLLLAAPPAAGAGLAGHVVKIADLGLALLLALDSEILGSSVTPERAVLGTLDYMAPEQADDSHVVDIRADVYSLGCTLYRCLTGSPPFPGGVMADKLYHHRHTEPRPVEELRPDLPPGLAATVRTMMAKKPADRPQTPAEVVAALAPFCCSAAALAVPSPVRPALEPPRETVPSPRAARARFGKKSLMPAAALVLLAALVAWLARPSPPRPDPSPAVLTRVQTLEGHSRAVTALAFSNGGKQLAGLAPTGRRDLLLIWNIVDGSKQRSLDCDASGFRCVTFCLRGALLVAGPGQSMMWWGAGDQPLFQFSKGFTAAAASGDDRFATGGPKAFPAVTLWFLEGAKPESILLPGSLHQEDVMGLSFSPDGGTLLSWSRDGCVKRWDVRRPRLGRFDRDLWVAPEPPTCLAVSRSQRLLAAGRGDGTIELIDAASGKPRLVIEPAHAHGARSLAFAAADRVLLSAGPSASGEAGEVVLWEVASGRKLGAWSLPDAGASRYPLAVAPDGRHLATAGGTGVVYVLRLPALPE